MFILPVYRGSTLTLTDMKLIILNFYVLNFLTAAWELSRNLVEIQILRLCAGPTELESAHLTRSAGTW